MMRPAISFVARRLGVLAIASGCVPAAAQTIDFETLPDSSPTADTQFISDQYLAAFGVRFDLVDPVTLAPVGEPRIAKVGAPETAFAGCGADTPLSDQGAGASFLTDNLSVTNDAGTLLVTYAQPVAAASGVILDVDRRSNGTFEQWTIEALDSSMGVLDTFVITAPTGADVCTTGGGPGDARAAGFAFSRPTADIAFLVLRYTGNAGSIGLAFDNFSPSTLPDPVQVSLAAPPQACEADPVTLSAMVSDGVPLFEYQWQADTGSGFVDLAGETGPTLTIVAAGAGDYRVRVTDALGDMDMSNAVTIDPSPLLGYLVEAEDAPGSGAYTQITGSLSPFQSAGTIADYYGYNSTDAIFLGPAPALEAERAHLFLVEGSDGIGAYMVYDSTASATSGRAEAAVRFTGYTPELLLQDDPSDANNGSGTGQINILNSWSAGFTDGFVVGPLSSIGHAEIAFEDVFGGSPTISGLTDYALYDSGGASFALPLAANQRVRLTAQCRCPADMNNNGVPDPGDFTAWIAAYNAGDLAADQNANGLLDPGDFTAWVANYNAGC
ncbi:MAG: GC-type dockerin domain-anchored protein [Phycisphaerales bacterium]